MPNHKEKETEFIDKLLEVKDEYEHLTGNTNELFRKRLSEKLAKRIRPYAFRDFVDFISDAEVIQRLY